MENKEEQVYEPIVWEAPTKVKDAYVILPDGTELIVTPAKYEGRTPINDVNLNKMDEAIAYLFENGVGGGGGDNTPIGTIFAYGGENAPEGYLLANGQEVSRTEYVDLFNVYGTTYGEGNGSTTFNVPDYRDRVPVGLNVNTEYFNSLGKKGGEANHTLTIAEMPSHNHVNIEVGGNYLTAWNNKTGNASIFSLESLSSSNGTANQNNFATGMNGGNQPHNNLQPYIVTNYIIKATKVTPTQAEVEDSLESNSTTNAPSVHAVNETLNGTILWSNIDTTKDFAATTLTIENLSEYNLLEIYYNATKSDNLENCNKFRNKVGNGTLLCTSSQTNTGVNFSRKIIIATSNTIDIDRAIQAGIGGFNENLIPTRVVGYK